MQISQYVHFTLMQERPLTVLHNLQRALAAWGRHESVQISLGLAPILRAYSLDTQVEEYDSMLHAKPLA